MNYCSLSLLSGIAVACGCSLLDWLMSPFPEEAEIREAVKEKAGVFGYK